MDAAPTPNPVPAPAPLTPPEVVRAWPPAAQWVTAILLGVAATLLLVHSFSYLSWGARPTALQRANEIGYEVDLNRADRTELRQLPGLGETLVQRILDYRQNHGPFRSVDELRKVQGIGPTTLARLRPLVYVAEAEVIKAPAHPSARTDSVPVRLTLPSVATSERRPPGKKEEQLKERIDINRATVDELQKLPGIGPKMSQRIVEERAKRPFQSVEELRRVPGIGPKTLEKLRPFVTVGDPQRVAQSG